jgi:hypothetical protein
MDIRTQRNIEKLLRLMDVRPGVVAPVIEVRDGAIHVFVEVREPRVIIAAMLPVEPVRAHAALRALLNRWAPVETDGVPLRAFCVEAGVFVSCAMPVGSGAEFWYRILRAQRSLLERCVKEQA